MGEWIHCLSNTDGADQIKRRLNIASVRYLWIRVENRYRIGFQNISKISHRISTTVNFRKNLVRRGFARLYHSHQNVKKFCRIQKAGIFVAAN
jgi:hypothetical protein